MFTKKNIGKRFFSNQIFFFQELEKSARWVIFFSCTIKTLERCELLLLTQQIRAQIVDLETETVKGEKEGKRKLEK